MSLQPRQIEPVPEQTARIARAAFPKGNLYLRMRDEFDTLFTDEQFADLFPTRGQSAYAPWRLALVTVMQFIENLSDQQAAEMVRARLDWKYALSLELDDTGFDSSVLCEFRTRLLSGQAEARLFETMLTAFQTRNLLKSRGRQRTDSTHILVAVRALNRLETIGETLRFALNTLAEVDPDWLLARTSPDWFDRYGKRMEAYRLPRDKAEREQLARTMGADGIALLSALAAADTPPTLQRLAAVQTLRQVWRQQFWLEGGQVRLRDEADMPPSAQLIRSPYDPEARLSVKRETHWTGYKVHLSETCDPDTPHLITHVHTTEATTPDSTQTPLIQQGLAQSNRLPAQHLVDEGYTEAEYLVSSQQQHQIELLGPVAINPSWQASAGKGFDVASFRIDWEQRCAYCPAGHRSRKWARTRNARGGVFILTNFDPAHCRTCQDRHDCTRAEATGRTLYLHPRPEYEALHAARERQQTPEFRELYAARAGIEGTLSQGVRVCGLRTTRYVGRAKTHLQNLMTAAALNFCRVVAWLEGVPLATTRTSRFARLNPKLLPAR